MSFHEMLEIFVFLLKMNWKVHPECQGNFASTKIGHTISIF